ncbi:MAG TPA: prephenate dehydratase [Vicinamibacterales bacterium]|nr:prephenate dehydratase [Vicinamibacterales bacterium]
MSGRAVATAAYQGAPGAFSEDAIEVLAPGARPLPCETLELTLDALARGAADLAVVPIENTLAGAVPGCADLLVRHDVHVAGECVVPIRHALVAAPGGVLSGIRRVRSHPVALAQCERFLRRHPAMTLEPAYDTAGAAAEIIERGETDAAAVASARVAALYGGVVLEADIQDRPDNATRFLLVRRGPAGRTWHAGYRTSLYCVLDDVPGALVRALEAFARRQLNLSRIESRPTKETPFEYGFLIDLAAGPHVAAIGEAMADAERVCRRVRLIGHYPRH